MRLTHAQIAFAVRAATDLMVSSGELARFAPDERRLIVEAIVFVNDLELAAA